MTIERNDSELVIRNATESDQESIQRIYTSAFAKEESEAVSKLACDLLALKSEPAVLSLMAEWNGTAVGHVCFSPISFAEDENVAGYILAPLAVEKGNQNRKIGTHLVEQGIAKLASEKASIFLVYGDPKYYGRFGFTVEGAEKFVPPYKLQYPFGWQVLVKGYEGDQLPFGKIRCVAPLCDPSLW